MRSFFFLRLRLKSLLSRAKRPCYAMLCYAMLCYTMLCMRDLASDLVPPYGRLRLISNVISRHVQIVCKAYPIACIVCCRDTWFLSQQWAEPQIACSPSNGQNPKLLALFWVFWLQPRSRSQIVWGLVSLPQLVLALVFVACCAVGASA